MQLADYAFEQRLIERIALKEAVAARLTMRQRRVLFGRLQGYTRGEIGSELGVSAAGVNVIEQTSLHRLRAPKLGLNSRVPLPLAMPVILRKPPPPEPWFNPAAFLEHMRGLIRRRVEHEAQAFEFELADTRRLADMAKPPPPAPTPPPLTTQQRINAYEQNQRLVAAEARRRAAEQAAYAASLQAHIDAANAPTADTVRLQAHIDLVHAAQRQQAPPDYQAQLQIGLARREWAGVRGTFAMEAYEKIRMPRTVAIYGWRLDGGSEYWLPLSVIKQLTATVAVTPSPVDAAAPLQTQHRSKADAS